MRGRLRIVLPAFAAALAAAMTGALHAQVSKPAAAQGRTSKPASIEAYNDRYASTCAVCHGQNGRSEVPGVPVLAGQPSLYAITQLFLFREGRRNHPAMVAIAKDMTDTDLRGFSEFIGKLPPIPAPVSSRTDADLTTKGRMLAQKHKCTVCHGDDLSGGQQVPRIAGQKEDYVRATLVGYKDGTLKGYTPAMAEALAQVPEADLELLARYAAALE